MPDPGNTLAAATQLNLGATPQSFTDSVSSTDTLDYYRLKLSGRSSFDLKLTGLSNDANVALIRDVNSNGAVDSGETLFSSTNAGALAESINLANLDAGIYYLQVSLGSESAVTNYTLGLSAQSQVQSSQVVDWKLQRNVIDW
jgi:hypothetical protein